MAAGESRRFRIGYTLAADTPSGPLQNTASISSTTTDPNTANDSSSVTVLVDAPPTASFTYTPATPRVGDNVRFDANGSNDDHGITGFAWAFGDGGTGTGLVTNHAYSIAGSYAATLTVTDAIGGTSSATRTVVVSNVGPNPPPSAGRALRGTVTRIVAFGPGGDPAGGRVPLAGAVVTVGSARQGGIQTTTDAQGRYVFTNLSCGSCDIEVAAPGSTTAILQTSVTIGANPGLTVRDLVVGTGRDQLYVTGVLLPAGDHPGDPQPPAPLTVGVRVYAGSLNNPNNIVADSARVFPGPGGFGAYQLLVGQIGRVPPQIRPGTQLQVVLVENGVNVTSTTPVTFRVPPVSAGFAPQVVTAADLVGPNPPPSAGRALRGTVTRIVAFGPGGDPAGGRVPLAGAVVTVGSARQGGIQTTTDAQGRYVFTNLSCGSCDIEVAAPGSTTAILQTSVTIGANPGLTVRDLVVGTGRDQLYVTGVLRPPATNPGDPQPPAPLTVGVRVYAGSLNNPNNIVADSARVFPGPGGFGAYQLLVGQIGRVPPQIGPGTQLQVVLVENGVNVTSTTPVTFRVPPVSAGFAPQVVTAADLVGPNPPPSAGRALRGTVTRIVAFGPGGDPAGGRVPLAGAVVTVGSARQGGIQTTTDAQGRYVFTNLSCGSCDIEVAAPGSTTAILQTSVTIGANPGLTVRDLVVGTGRDQLYVTGVLRPPATNPGDPQPPAPLTVGVRVYAGSLNNPNNIVADSARVFPGPGGFGAYQLLVGQIGRVPPQIGPGTQLQVVLVENGVNVTSTTPVTFRVPPVSAGFAPQVVTAADLVGR